MTKNWRIFASVFLTGLSVMVLEIVGIRIISPYFGASFYIWTALIGSILTFLSLGYYLGGILSLKQPSLEKLSYFIAVAGIWIFLLALGKDFLLTTLTNLGSNIYLEAFTAVITLFALPSILLGIVSPYSAKIIIQDLSNSGLSVGKLYAVSTIGSIFGTFLTGFILIPHLGHIRVLFIIAFLLSFTSILLSSKLYFLKLFLLSLCFLGMLSPFVLDTLNSNLKAEIDTQYSRVRLFDNQTSLGTERLMYIDEANSSGVVLEDKTKLVFDYYQYYDLMFWHQEKLQNILLVGGAGMGYPRYIATKYQDINMTVVEIDPKLYELSTKYMDYQPNPNIKMVFADGRFFLNRNNQKYDAILFDVFSGYTIPWHLVTKEATLKIKNSLSGDGIVIINLIGSTKDDKSLVANSIINTYRQIFPQVEVFSVLNPPSENSLQNIVLVASNKKLDFKNNSLAENSKKLLGNQIAWPFQETKLTDDFAPIDYYSFKMSN